MTRPSRRRRHRAAPASSMPAAPSSPPVAAALPIASPAVPSREAPSETDSGEQAWERTHLEQTMFTLAREHADAAARCARASPPNREGEQTHSLVAMLMSFLALEAFINMVGADRLGPRYRHYDRMSPEGKWMEVTRLVSKTGKTFAEEGKELRALSELRSWRNMLTHYKGEYEDVQHAGRGGETRIEALLSAENAERALEIARTLYRAFYAFDRRSAPRQFVWLDDRPHRPKPLHVPNSATVAAAGSPSAASGGGQAAEPAAPEVRRSRRRRRRRH